MASTVLTALDTFIQRALKLTSDGYFRADFDPEWRSECEVNGPDGDEVRWRPVLQRIPVNFSGLENALEFPIHPDIAAYYGSYWSNTLEATADEGHVSLIQLWNPQDFDRLIENLIGHALAKQRIKQPFTVFIATTAPDSELFLSIDNQSGKVLLEEPGKPPLREVEENVAKFLDRLKPVDRPPRIY
ncbi:MAG: SecY-interacting protein [Pseudomonadales bacterium]